MGCLKLTYNHLKVLKPSKKCVYRQKKQSRLNFKNRVNKLLYRFNAKEFDSNTGLYYFGARYMNPKYGLWLSPDPLGDFNPFMNSEHYIDGEHNGGVFNNRNLNAYAYCYQSPIVYVDPNGKQTYFIHGTTSEAKRWNETANASKLVQVVSKLTNSKYLNTGFSWNAPIYNNETMRNLAAYQLADYVMKHKVAGEEITLVGHSHGGNVAIQASALIAQKTGKKVNLITIATPAYNKTGDYENPGTYKNYVNDHIALWNKIDGVSGGLAGDDNFTNSPITTNIEINVDKYYLKTKNESNGNKTKEEAYFKAHSFDVEHPEVIQKSIDNGSIRKLKSIE